MVTINRSFAFHHISPGARVRIAAFWFHILWNLWSGRVPGTALETAPAAEPRAQMLLANLIIFNSAEIKIYFQKFSNHEALKVK